MGNKTATPTQTSTKPNTNTIKRSTGTNKIILPKDDWIELKKPPYLFATYQPNPLYFHSTNNQNRYIIFTPGGSPKCIKYDIINDEYETIENKTSKLKFTCHGHCIDTQNKLLYVFTENGCCQYNIIKNEWNNDINNVIGNKFNFPGICYVSGSKSSNINNINVFMKGSYYTWNNNQNKCQFISKLSLITDTYSMLFYCAGKLYLITSDKYGTPIDRIYYCDILNGSSQWKNCSFKLPSRMKLRYDTKVVVAFDCILIVFYYPRNKIWYLDLKSSSIENNKFIWKESKIECEDKRSQFVVIVNNTFVHCINAYGANWTVSHKKIHLAKIIGSELCAKYDGRLVNGWLRLFVQIYIPVDIVDLICTFFS